MHQSIVLAKADKRRLDIILLEKGLVSSRRRGQALIMAGRVWVNETPVSKPGTLVSPADRILLRATDMPYVSRGGIKLKEALYRFHIEVNNRVCMDVGASTGGFTDCLLQQGARRVYSVDVGYGQLAWKLRRDSRVNVIERTNIRHMPQETIPELLDLITIDVSFISLRIVIPAVIKFLHSQAQIVALIKPQFEAGKGQVGKGGVVRDPELHQQIIQGITDFVQTFGFKHAAIIPSPIHGPKGNIEFFMHLKFEGQRRGK